ncbi:MAG: class 1 fructose-bisphosphatase [Xanthomonadales bacterium]|nr:class 1 fructose-bisphosphatase [Gammaproteobacteria bacterium]MBT8053195.1 class 1 fructose-bisphosphatase [Gammaproteobacteria bacterium]NND58354.1 class 1 fructose-bisphosphatase [Xanthomonadales bacterium]NNK50234.1 class 1 fructose-bisphosphatase [Xanthomonadales bacterium]
MTEHETLKRHLNRWANRDEMREAVAATMLSIADSCCAISEVIALGPLAGSLGASQGQNVDGDIQYALDMRANELIIDEMIDAPVAYLASEELELPVPINQGAPLYVAIDPLDGSSNIDTNVSVGTIFSVMPMKCDKGDSESDCFLQQGTHQLAAGYVIYGPQTAMVMTLGEGTHIFTLNPDTGEFCLTTAHIAIPEDTNEFAINTSNFRRWDGHVKAYIDDCLDGAEGPHEKNYNTRWIASLVAECHRILVRGGIFLYPGDRREAYRSGRLRLAYECNPIAFLVEQAGGAATTGNQRILEIEPTDIHQRAPLIFGSRNEVNLLAHYYAEVHPMRERSQLFGNRGLFRTG